MDVSIIIVNYNTKDVTDICINSVIKQTSGVDYEIILVDNASSDGSREFFSSRKEIVYIYNKNNVGFGRANNIGLEHASGKYIFFLNSDTVLLNNALKHYCEFARCHDNLGVIGSFLVDGKCQRTHSFGTFPSISNLWEVRLKSLTNRNKKENSRIPKEIKNESYFEVDYVTGADMFVERKVLDKVGYFDPDFFMYFEETELQYRIRRSGYANVIILTPKIMHLEGKSFSSDGRNFNKELIIQRSSLLYYKKTSTNFYYILFRIFFFFFEVPKILFQRAPLSYKMKLFHIIIC